jgi:peroxiredoxin
MRSSGKIRAKCLAALLALSLATPLAGHAMVSKGASPPPLNLVSTSGQNITLSNYKGYVLIIDFFAMNCAPCRLSIPHLIDLNNRYGKKGLQILGVSLDEGADKAVKAYIAEKKINYPVAMANEDMVNDYAIRSIPKLFIINKKGHIIEWYQGYNDDIEKSLETLIKKLLAE